MTEKLLPFPAHIYDPQRIQLATTLLEKELRKLFLGLPSVAWSVIDNSIRGWAERPLDYHLESEQLRDFWDAFAAVMEGIKLKPNFVAWVTAENMSWQKMTLQLQTIRLTSPLQQLQKVPGLNLSNDISVADVSTLLADNPKAKTEQRTLVDQHSSDPSQDTYPIIVRKVAANTYKIMDGNRRTLKALLYDQEKIEAWVGEMSDEHPVNYWVPIHDMYKLVKMYQTAGEAADSQTQAAIARSLWWQFQASKVAELAYLNRVADETEAARQLYNATQRPT